MVIKNSFIYLSTETINKAIPFLLLPIITKYLTPAEYGVYGMYQVLISFLTPIIGMSLDINLTRNFFKVSKEKLKEIISSIVTILHFNLLIGLFIVFIVSLFIQDPFCISNKFLYILPIIIYAQVLNSFNLTILRNEEKALKYGFFQITITIINFTTVLFLLLFLEQGWSSLIYGVLIANISVLYFSFKSLSFSKIFYPFKEIYKISLPLIFHLLGGSIIFLSDRIFIQQMIGLENVGFYSIGNQFGMITMIVINAIIMAINPWMYKNLAKNNQNIVKKIYLFMGLFTIIGISVWIGSIFIFPYFVDEKFSSAKSVILWISLAFVIRGWYQLFYNIIVHEGKTWILMYITFGGGILNLVLNYFLIKLYGINGAAMATLFAFLFMWIVVFIYSNKISALRP